MLDRVRVSALIATAVSLCCCQVYDSSLLTSSVAGGSGGATGGSAGLDAGGGSATGGSSGGSGGATGGSSGADAGGGSGGATGGSAGADAGGGSGGATGGSGGSGGASTGPSGDVHVYFGIGSAVSMRTWSHVSQSWSATSPVGVFTGPAIPWIDPAILGSSEIVAVSSWSGNNGASASLHLLEAPSFQAAFPAQAFPGTVHRSFDVAYEQIDGDGLVVFGNGTSDPLFSTRRHGSTTTWTSPAPVFAQAPSGTAVVWVQLASNPTTNEISLVYSDTSNELFGATWINDAWTTAAPTKLDTNLNSSDFPAFVAAYSATSGNLLVAWSHPSSCHGGVDPLYYSVKLSGSSTFSSTATSSASIAGPGPMVAASQPGTNRIAIAMLEFCAGLTGGDNDFSAATWDGGQFVATTDLDSSPGTDYTSRVGSMPVGVAWVGANKALAVYEATSTLMYTTWSSSGGWTPPALASVGASSVVSDFQLLRLHSGDAMLLMEDAGQSLWATSFDGTTFTDTHGGAPIGISVYSGGGRPFGAVVVP